MEQDENKIINSSDFEEEQKELLIGFVKRILTTLTEIMGQFDENYTNFDKSSKARRGVIDTFSTCKKLLTAAKMKLH